MKSMTYNGVEYGRRKIINNIVRTFDQSTVEERGFYVSAREHCKIRAVFHGTDFRKYAGVVAALSPLKSWSSNKKLAEDLFRTGQAGHTRLQVGKARKIQQLSAKDIWKIPDILGGDKTKNFYRNIIGVFTGLTLDRHAVYVATNTRNYNGLGKASYAFLERCYVDAADKVGVKPYELQSATWYVSRRK